MIKFRAGEFFRKMNFSNKLKLLNLAGYNFNKLNIKYISNKDKYNDKNYSKEDDKSLSQDKDREIPQSKIDKEKQTTKHIYKNKQYDEILGVFKDETHIVREGFSGNIHMREEVTYVHYEFPKEGKIASSMGKAFSSGGKAQNQQNQQDETKTAQGQKEKSHEYARTDVKDDILKKSTDNKGNK
jgi:hypothetical protein